MNHAFGDLDDVNDPTLLSTSKHGNGAMLEGNSDDEALLKNVFGIK